MALSGSQQATHDSGNDEIDLRDLIVGLYQGRWLIVSAILGCVALALAYIIAMPQTQKVSLEVKTIDFFTSTTYGPLSNTGFLSINAGNLSNWFFEDPQPYLVDNMLKLDYLVKQTAETEAEFALRVGQEAANFEFLAPTKDEKAKIARPNWIVKFHTTNPELARQLVADTFADINSSVQKKLQAQLAFNIQQHETDLANQLEDIKLKIASREAAYKANIARKVAVISEQAQIARSLGVANNQLVSNMEGNKDLVVLANQSMPTYLNGYIALEKEIELLQQRGESQQFMAEIADLMAQKYNLENNQVVRRAQQLYKLTPLASDDFAAVYYHLANMQFKPKLSSILLLALAIILGGMLGVMILIVRNVVRQP